MAALNISLICPGGKWVWKHSSLELAYCFVQMVEAWNFTLAKTTKSTQVHVGVASKVLDDVAVWRYRVVSYLSLAMIVMTECGIYS